MANKVTFDYSLTENVISADEIKSMEKITNDAKELLLSKEGAGSVQRSYGEYRKRAGYKHFLCPKCRAAGGYGRDKGIAARNVRLPRQEVPNRESEAESRVQGDALRQTTITILSTVKISISNETDFCNVRPLAGRVCGKRTNH